MTAKRGASAKNRSKAAAPGAGARQQAAGITLRPIRRADQDLLRRIYASTRADEMALLDWDEARKEAFLGQQFEAQHKYYQQQFQAARFDIIEQAGRPIGRLYVDRREQEFRIIDIALLPEARGAGIGGAIMRDLLDEATAAGKRVTIHVERYNRALRLYRRLGFTEIEDQGVYLLMDWSPEGAAAP